MARQHILVTIITLITGSVGLNISVHTEKRIEQDTVCKFCIVNNQNSIQGDNSKIIQRE